MRLIPRRCASKRTTDGWASLTTSDKAVAGMRAREVPGAFAVDNELVVEKDAPKSTKK
jgi:hypothetical protein